FAVAGWLGFRQRVRTGPEVEEGVEAVGIRQLLKVDGVAQVIGPGQGDGDAGNPFLAEVHLAVVVEVHEHDARQARPGNDGNGRRAVAGAEVGGAAVGRGDGVTAQGEE